MLNSLKKNFHSKILYFLIYFLIITCFYAFLYKYFGRFNEVHDESEVDSVGKINFFTAFYFSLTTQSTVGYGDISPKDNITKIICMTHLLLTIIIMTTNLL